MSELINADSMGIFTESQREFAADADEQEAIKDETQKLAAPYYTPDWNIFALACDGQVATWNSVNALGNLGGIPADEIKAQLIARQLASDFVATFKQTVLLAMKEKEQHGRK